MIYTKYLFKLGFKNKLNLIPLLIPVFIMIFLFIMNTQTVGKTGYIAFLNSDVSLMNGVLDTQEGVLKDDKNISDKDQIEIQDANSSLTKNIELKKKSIALAKEEKWSESLKIELSLMEENELKDIKNNTITNSENFINNTLMKYARYTKLEALNAEPQTEGIETKGINFTYRMMDSIFPVIFMICLIALISNIMSASIIGRIDIETLFPEIPFKFHLKKITILTVLGIIFYIGFLSISFAFSSIIAGTGTLKYPINIFTEGFSEIQSISEIMLKSFGLQILSILFVISAVYFISVLAKNGLTTLFVSTLLILGAVLLTGQIAPLYKILNLLPTTYINSIQVVTNKLAFETQNTAITFTNGILVLLFSSIILIAATLGIKVYGRKKEMLIK